MDPFGVRSPNSPASTTFELEQIDAGGILAGASSSSTESNIDTKETRDDYEACIRELINVWPDDGAAVGSSRKEISDRYSTYPQVCFIQQGSFNRVIAFEIPSEMMQHKLFRMIPQHVSRCVFRVPQEQEPNESPPEPTSVCDNVAIHILLSPILHGVPKLYGYDLSNDNAFKKGWMMMECVEGEPLSKALRSKRMTQQQKNQCMRSFIRACVSIERIHIGLENVEQFGAIGPLCCSSSFDIPTKWVLDAGALPSSLGLSECFKKRKPLVRIDSCGSASKSVLDSVMHSRSDAKLEAPLALDEFIRQEFELRIRGMLRQGASPNDDELEIEKLGQSILKVMIKCGIFRFPQDSKPMQLVLSHQDAEPRNVIVGPNPPSTQSYPDGSCNATLVDLDSVKVVPRQAIKPLAAFWDPDGVAAKCWAEESPYNKHIYECYMNKVDADDVPMGWYHPITGELRDGRSRVCQQTFDEYVRCLALETGKSEAEVKEEKFGRGRLQRKLLKLFVDRCCREHLGYRTIYIQALDYTICKLPRLLTTIADS